jgi:Uma2 family endonuclease
MTSQDAKMTTATAATDRITEADGDQCVEFRDIDWKGYSTLLRVRGERSIPRMIYLDGSLRLMSPSYRHENLKERLGVLVTEVVTGLKIRCVLSGQTTFRRRAKRGGVEGDHSYYLANANRVRGKKQINLSTDPPPDLVIEAVATHKADDALEVYRRLRVPEVWVCTQTELTIWVLQPTGRYAECERSVVLPVLSAREIHYWVTKIENETDTEWMLEVRRWVAEVLAPRQRGNPES